MRPGARNFVLRTTERLVYSTANYWLVLVTDVLGALVFLILSVRWYSGSRIAAIVLAVAGFMAWGLLEYVLHRWIFHGRYSMAQRGHARHHADATAHVATPVLIIMGLAFVVWAMLSVIMPAGIACVLVCGLYVGYNWYAIVHHLHHHREDDLAQVGYFRRLKRIHGVHHRCGRVNFGISSSLWDRVFGTFQLESPTRSLTDSTHG